jgi:hypothetical protein
MLSSKTHFFKEKKREKVEKPCRLGKTGALPGWSPPIPSLRKIITI